MPPTDGPALDPPGTPGSGRQRAERVYAALFRIHERYAATEAGRARLANPHLVGPGDAVRLVAALGSGSAAYLDDAEPQVQVADLVAALTPLPMVRAEIDDLEVALLTMAHGEGMTWAQIAAGLGAGSPRAAQQRHDRLSSRARRAADAGG